MTDEMPARTGALLTHRVDLRRGLLHAILAEIAQTRIERGTRHIHGMRLRHADKRYVVRRSTCALRGSCGAAANSSEIGRDVRHHRAQRTGRRSDFMSKRAALSTRSCVRSKARAPGPSL